MHIVAVLREYRSLDPQAPLSNQRKMSWRYDSFTLYGTTGAAKTTGKVEVRLAPVARFVTPKNSSLPLKSVAIFAACEVVCSLGDLAAAYPVNKVTVEVDATFPRA